MSSYRPLKLPYEQPYTIQKKGMALLIGDEKLVHIEQPTGTGKTTMVLASLLPRNEQIYYFCQSHDQAKVVIEEVKRLNKENGTSHQVVHVGGRSQLCVAPNMTDIKYEMKRIQICKMNRRKLAKGDKDPTHENCSLELETYHERKIEDTHVMKLDVINTMGVRMNKCPRAIMSHAVETAKVIVMPYNYLVNPLNTMSRKDKLVVLDEAHNIDTKLIDLATKDLNYKSLNTVANWCKKNKKNPLANSLLENVETVQLALHNLPDSPEIYPFSNHSIMEMEAIKDMELDLDLLFEGTQEETKLDRMDYPASMYEVYMTVRMMTKILDHPKVWGDYIFIVEIDREDYTNVRLRPLTPSYAFRRHLKRHKKVVMMSGTLSSSYMSKILRAKPDISKSFGSIHKGARGFYIPTIKDKGEMFNLTTKYTSRGKRMWKNYAKLIVYVSSFTPSGKLMFAPSYTVADKIKNAIIDIRKEEGQLPFEIFTELPDYLQYMSNPDNKALFISSFRGEGSEGVNFKDHYARAIFLCGVPVLPPTNEFKYQVGYLNKKGYNLGSMYSKRSAIVPVAQANGRGMRHMDDWCVSYYLDDRFSQYIKFIPQWLRESIVWDHNFSWIKKLKMAKRFVNEKKNENNDG